MAYVVYVVLKYGVLLVGCAFLLFSVHDSAQAALSPTKRDKGGTTLGNNLFMMGLLVVILLIVSIFFSVTDKLIGA